MALILHIIIALSSLAFSAYVLFRPSGAKLQASYALIAGTVASGTFLVIAKPAHMAETCTMGLVYVGAVSFATLVAHRKLAAQKISAEK